MLHPAQPLSLTNLTVHPSTVIGVTALGALYAWRASRLPRAERPSPVRVTLFASALLVILLVLNGPLHDLSDYYLFSAHMVQHLMLTILMPPLLLAGLTGPMLRPLLRVPKVFAVARVLTSPFACFLVFNLVLAAWHLPPLYNTAMGNHDVHIVQHLMFMAASVLMWWPYLSPLPELPRLGYPGQILYSFLMTIPMSIVSAWIVYSDTLLYPAYAAAPRILPLSPLEDQRLGALIMWIPGGIVFYGVMTVVFFRWASTDAEARAGMGMKQRTPTSPH